MHLSCSRTLIGANINIISIDIHIHTCIVVNLKAVLFLNAHIALAFFVDFDLQARFRNCNIYSHLWKLGMSMLL